MAGAAGRENPLRGMAMRFDDHVPELCTAIAFAGEPNMREARRAGGFGMRAHDGSIRGESLR
jgi:hypothetical protein